MGKDKKYFDVEAENRKQASSEQRFAKNQKLKKKPVLAKRIAKKKS
jgi:hypothetical protein